ncbi:hypothetical protein [Tenacibaculum amylolyticum]|uniref:hypothetical protein n=1 Tax=Tenacibaculum amylolyticum TaxID=104269 RepID=UPI003895CD7D
MKNKTIKVAMLMALGFLGLHQVQAQHVESTQRAYRISADTDSSGGEGIQFYVRNQQLAYFFPGQNVFLTKTYFDGETILQNIARFNKNAHFNAETFFNGRIRASSIGIGVNPEGSAIHVKNNNIRVDGGQYQSYGPIVLHPDVDRNGDDFISFKNSTNVEMAKLQDGVFTLKANQKLKAEGQLNIQGSTISFENGDGNEQARLDNGTLSLNQIRLNVSTFPDYVFANDYKLMPLEEVDVFIQKHKHLPNMPSEAKVVKEGMNVGEVNTVLVEKVEELTLYIIQLKKELDTQRKELEILKKSNKRLTE